MRWLSILLVCFVIAPDARASDGVPPDGEKKAQSSLEAVTLSASYSNWLFYIHGRDQTTDEYWDFSQVTTKEEYDIDPIHAYRFSAAVRGHYFDLGLRFESNSGLGFSVKPSFVFGGVLDVLDLGDKWGKVLSLELARMDFHMGRVSSTHKTTGQTTTYPFHLVTDAAELRIGRNPAKGTATYGFLRYMDYSAPRSVWLKVVAIREPDEA